MGEESLCKHPSLLCSALFLELFPSIHLARSQYPIMETGQVSLLSLSSNDSSCCLLSTYEVPGTVHSTLDTWYHLSLGTFWEGE